MREQAHFFARALACVADAEQIGFDALDLGAYPTRAFRACVLVYFRMFIFFFVFIYVFQGVHGLDRS